MACSNNFVCGNKSADINGWPIRYTDCQQLTVYAARVLPSNSPFMEVVISSLATNRITYCKRTTGDCGSSGFAGTGSFAGDYGTALGAFAANDPEPISHTIAGIESKIFGFFGAAHARAVANEQSTLCKVADGWNSWIDGAERALASGSLPLQDAIVQLKQVYASLSNEAANVAKNKTDAANYYKAALDALLVWNKEIVFPQLAGSGSGVLGSETPLLLGGGILAAKLLGAF